MTQLLKRRSYRPPSTSVTAPVSPIQAYTNRVHIQNEQKSSDRASGVIFFNFCLHKRIFCRFLGDSCFAFMEEPGRFSTSSSNVSPPHQATLHTTIMDQHIATTMKSEFTFYFWVAFLFPFPSCFLSSRMELHVDLDGSFDPYRLWEYLSKDPQLILCFPVTKECPWAKQKPLPLRRVIIGGIIQPSHFETMAFAYRGAPKIPP
jgi:hypothetical protein